MRSSGPRTAATLSLCFLLLGFAPAVAMGQDGGQDGGQKKTPTKAANGVELVKRTFQRLDGNKDGAVTQKEAQRAKISPKLFLRHDDDRSSGLCTDEFAVLYKDLLVQAGRPVSKELQDEVTRIQSRRRAKEAEERAKKKEAEAGKKKSDSVKPQGVTPGVVPGALNGARKDVAREGQTTPTKGVVDPKDVQGSTPAGGAGQQGSTTPEGTGSGSATPEQIEQRIREARIKQAALDEQRIREARIKQAALDEQRIREARIKAANAGGEASDPKEAGGAALPVGKVKNAGRRKPAKVTTNGGVEGGASKPASAKPEASKPTPGQGAKGKPGTAKPGTAKPGTAKPGTAEPAKGKPDAGKPSKGDGAEAQKTEEQKDATGKPGSPKPATEKPVQGEPDQKKPDQELPVENKPAPNKGA